MRGERRKVRKTGRDKREKRGVDELGRENTVRKKNKRKGQEKWQQAGG